MNLQARVPPQFQITQCAPRLSGLGALPIGVPPSQISGKTIDAVQQQQARVGRAKPGHQ